MAHPQFFYHDTAVQVDAAFRMRGALIASVTATAPIFVTDGRLPGRPTRHGWVKARELTVVFPEQQEVHPEFV